MGRLNYLHQCDVPHRAIAVYLYLIDRADSQGRCWPAIPTIARELKLSESTVRRGIKDLKRVGILTTAQRYRPNGGKSSLCYQIAQEKPHKPP